MIGYLIGLIAVVALVLSIICMTRCKTDKFGNDKRDQPRRGTICMSYDSTTQTHSLRSSDSGQCRPDEKTARSDTIPQLASAMGASFGQDNENNDFCLIDGMCYPGCPCNYYNFQCRC